MGRDHIHRYRRVNIGKDGKEHWVMRCVKGNCTHYIQMASKWSAPLLKGNIAECSRCYERFILNKRALRMENPCCDDCVKRRVPEKQKSAEEFFEELTKEVIEAAK